MANLLSFPARVPITADGQLASAEFIRFLANATFRMGGASAPSIQELDGQQYSDAGIEESKQAIYSLAQDFSTSPVSESVRLEAMATEICELRETVAQLVSQINELKQGTMI